MNFVTHIKPVLKQPHLILNTLLLLSFCAVFIRDFLFWLPRDAYGTSLNYWAYTDWLVDYSQGFIRRGLSGEIWRFVPKSIPPIEFVSVFSWILILVIAFGYVRLLVRSLKALHPLTLFGLLFLPSLFFFYLHDHNAIARKEILGYVTLLLHLFVIEKTFPLGSGSTADNGNLNRYLWWLTPIAVIILPAITLIHEGNFLLFVPVHAMITLTILRTKIQSSFKRAAIWTGLFYLPAALVFGAVYLSGTPGYPVLLGICQKWLAAGAIREGSCVLPPDKLSGSTLPGSFIPMQWPLLKAAGITLMIILTNLGAWLLILPILGVSLWYTVWQAVYSILLYRFSKSFSPQSALRYTKEFFMRFFVIPFAFSLPIYFTAYDYGRWFTVICVNFAMLAVSANLPCWDFVHRQKKIDEESGLADWPEHLDNRWLYYGVSVGICILAVILVLPHFCLFKCEIIRSPLDFLSHNYIAR